MNPNMSQGVDSFCYHIYPFLRITGANEPLHVPASCTGNLASSHCLLWWFRTFVVFSVISGVVAWANDFLGDWVRWVNMWTSIWKEETRAAET